MLQDQLDAQFFHSIKSDMQWVDPRRKHNGWINHQTKLPDTYGKWIKKMPWIKTN
jgi:hypothetical protein